VRTSLLRTSRKLLRPLTLVAALVVVLVMPKPGWANSCSTITLSSSSLPFTCTIPEQTPEIGLTATINGLSFTSQAQGVVLIFDDSTHTILSDVAIFSNVGGVATVTFLSDTDGIPLTAKGLPVLGRVTEGGQTGLVSVALSNGKFLHAEICSDVEGGPTCSGASDSITLEVYTPVPEPGTFLLLGSGLLGSGALKFSAVSLRRRLLRRKQS
jgi:hypothetical protein